MLLMCPRKLRTTYFDSKTKVSSTYRFRMFGGRLNVVTALLSKLSINMLATKGDNRESKGSLSVCTCSSSLNVNAVDLRQSEHSPKIMAAKFEGRAKKGQSFITRVKLI